MYIFSMPHSCKEDVGDTFVRSGECELLAWCIMANEVLRKMQNEATLCEAFSWL